MARNIAMVFLAKVFLVGAIALVSLPALATDTRPAQQQTVQVQVQKERLANGYKTLAAHSAVTKGAVKQAEIARQRREIKDLIQRLEAGEQVAPGEVDRVLQAH